MSLMALRISDKDNQVLLKDWRLDLDADLEPFVIETIIDRAKGSVAVLWRREPETGSHLKDYRLLWGDKVYRPNDTDSFDSEAIFRRRSEISTGLYHAISEHGPVLWQNVGPSNDVRCQVCNEQYPQLFLVKEGYYEGFTLSCCLDCVDKNVLTYYVACCDVVSKDGPMIPERWETFFKSSLDVRDLDVALSRQPEPEIPEERILIAADTDDPTSWIMVAEEFEGYEGDGWKKAIHLITKWDGRKLMVMRGGVVPEKMPNVREIDESEVPQDYLRMMRNAMAEHSSPPPDRQAAIYGAPVYWGGRHYGDFLPPEGEDRKTKTQAQRKKGRETSTSSDLRGMLKKRL